MNKILLAFGAAAALMASAPAKASVFEETSLQEFVVKSTTSVFGKITSVETKRRGGLMVREFTLAVSDTVYGFTESEIKVITPGGTVPNTRFALAQVVDDSPQLRVGQEVMLVLNDMPNKDEYSVSGLSMGALNVRTVEGNRFVDMNDGKGFVSLSHAVEKLKDMRKNAR